MNLSNLLFLFSNKPITQVLNTTEFSEYDPHQSGFTSYYLKHLLPLQKALEDKRIESLKKLRKHCRLSLPISLISSFVLLMLLFYSGFNDGFMATLRGFVLKFPNWLIWLLIIAPPLLVLVWMLLISGGHGIGVKMAVLPKFPKFFGKGWKFKAHGGFDEALLIASGIIPEFNKMIATNMMHGKHQDCSLIIAELKLIRERKAGERQNKVPQKFPFWGVAISIEVGRKFNSKIIGIADRGSSYFLGKKQKHLSSISFDDQDFKSNFGVYTATEKETDLLLGSRFRKLLLELLKSFKESNGDETTLNFCFNNRKLLILVDSHAQFFSEPSIFTATFNPQEFKSYLQQVGIVRQIIESLK